MYLDNVVAAQKRGEARGVTSVCSAHPWVLKVILGSSDFHGTARQGRPSRSQATEVATTPVLIEATCNQVNQYGGYTGMTPANFVGYVRGIAQENGFPFENIILGGDHLGPNVWQDEPAESAMEKSRSEEHTSELQSPCNLVCRLLLEKKNKSHEQHTCK